MRGDISRYLERVAAHRDIDPDPLIEWVTRVLALGPVAPQWLLQVQSPAAPLILVEGTDRVWRCRKCGYRHLHRSADVCANRGCRSAGLIEEARGDAETDDYYAWLSGQRPRRLAIAELTGQTKPLEEQRRRQTLVQGHPAARARGKRHHQRARRAQRHHHDGGRCRHRIAEVGPDGQHAAAALQLPAASRQGGPLGAGVLLRAHRLP